MRCCANSIISGGIFPHLGSSESEKLNILSHVDTFSKTQETVLPETPHTAQDSDQETDSISLNISPMLKQHLPK